MQMQDAGPAGPGRVFIGLEDDGAPAFAGTSRRVASRRAWCNGALRPSRSAVSIRTKISVWLPPAERER
jgi:hypothetical protein